MNSQSAGPAKRPGLMPLLVAAGSVLLVLGFLFYPALQPGRVVFSNDGPLGVQMAESHRLPGTFTGAWEDLNTVGFQIGGGLANLTHALLLASGPVGFSKLYAPFALLVLGLGAYTFFRQLKLAPAACVLGALAACLNSSFFSAACWGVASHSLTIGMSFFALAALVDDTSKGRWIRTALAGLAIGMGVSEGADVGAIFSLLITLFVLYQAWGRGGARGLPQGALRVATMAAFAALIAAQTIVILIGTQIKGVAGTQQDSRTKEERWDWATQWSLPKRETLAFVVPGLFGYRMDTPEGGNYWGAVGRDPSWDRYFAGGKQGQPPGGFMRFSGGGIYSGILVAMVAVWAALQGLRKKESVFGPESQRWIWFWSGMFVVALLLSFGRFAPFYQLLYALPYFSTIRNPAKFTHVCNWAMVVLFAYGVHGLWLRYMSAEAGAGGLGLKRWWEEVKGFDRRWTLGCLGAFAVGVLGWLMFSANRADFVRYLGDVQLGGEVGESIARFSSRQVAIWLGFFAAAIGLVTLVISGRFRGSRALAGTALMGLFLVVDLGRANQPWVIPVDYLQKYATNPVIERLREKPYLGRVAILPPWIHQMVRAPAELQMIDQLYRIEWAQHHFLYYNIQSLDVVQMPRMPEDLAAFEGAFQPREMADLQNLVPRKWELTSTRYLVGAADYVAFLNQQLDPARKRFRVLERFEITPKPGLKQATRLEELTAEPSTNGPFALIEFTGALPRAKLYTDWQTVTNQEALLKQLASPSFKPEQTVLLAEPLPAGFTASGSNSAPASVEITSYAPKRITLKVQSPGNAVLLLNDRYDANWRVYLDGKPTALLRANYLMRAVAVPPNEHQVEFRFEPEIRPLYVSLAACVLAVLLCAALVLVRGGEGPPQSGKV